MSFWVINISVSDWSVVWLLAACLFVAPPLPCWVFPTPVVLNFRSPETDCVFCLELLFLDFNVFLNLDIVFLRTLGDLGRAPLAGKLFTFLVSFTLVLLKVAAGCVATSHNHVTSGIHCCKQSVSCFAIGLWCTFSVI